MTRQFLGFSPEVFAERRDRARRLLDGGAMVLPAAPVLLRSRDTEHRYRPDSELFYLTGCVDPGVVAVFRDAQEERFVLFVPEHDARKEMWSGPRLCAEEAGERLGADSAYPLDELEERLPSLLRPHPRVFFRLGQRADLEHVVVGALQWARTRGSRTGEGPRAVVDPGVVLDDLRVVKDEEEISRLRKATTLTVAAFRVAMGRIEPGLGEWEVEAILDSEFRMRGARGPAFPTIVGSGKNGCVLHYVENRESIRDGDLVLLDAGAEVDLYSGDVTRTFPASGRFLGPQRDVYQAVLQAYRAAMGQVRPGRPTSQVHEAAVRELTEGLVGLGVLEGRVDDLVEEKAYEPYFVHQTFHWLGLDVHDVGDYARAGRARTFEPGMVLTVEPGLYFPPTSESIKHPFSGIGVRIEDDLLVTEDGVENLTRDLPVRPEDLAEVVGALVSERFPGRV